MEKPIKIKYIGIFLLGKKTFLIAYSSLIMVTIGLLVYFFIFPIDSTTIQSPLLKWIAQNILLVLFLSLLGILLEAQFYWNKFTKAQLKIISEQKEEIENHKDELEAQNQEIETQKEHIETQKNELEKKQIRINQSIHYAKRIQKAVLQENALEKAKELEYGLFFQPRDQVSGDFYWSFYLNKKLYVSLADCTGHGIPGAFLSMFGFAALNNIAREFPQITAAEILEKLKNQIISSLHQSASSDRKEGMDMAILIFDFAQKTINFAGANQELIKIENNNLQIIKGDRLPVAFHKKENQKYNNQYIKFKKDEIYILYTDGFIDQIGGEHKRKYMRKNFRNFLKKNANQSISNQCHLIEKEFYQYKKEIAQVDDVSVLILKIKE